jgi:hypothetical protein
VDFEEGILSKVDEYDLFVVYRTIPVYHHENTWTELQPPMCGNKTAEVVVSFRGKELDYATAALLLVWSSCVVIGIQ